ncbi:hypothetical protein CO2235_MP40134 [Cupriavidus oxalaticus]|uniref:Uncharacterized protein n=1 Tax=Cupriavidus oxalaticus TaxID=96344 RepID=A0A976BI13_9BURK|nr:hypothetical protein CO2235_MP40134 [Cupriavidus oxalaticus]
MFSASNFARPRPIVRSVAALHRPAETET